MISADSDGGGNNEITVHGNKQPRASTDRGHSPAKMEPPADRSGITATVTAGSGLPSASHEGPSTLQVGPVGDITLLGTPVSLDSEAGRSFVADCARNIEGLKSDKELRDNWGLDEPDWGRLAENARLLNAIKTERQRRISSGEAAREAAQRHFVKAPSVLAAILENETISPRHRIEAAKELRQVAAGASENIGTGEKFVIMIDLGEDQRLVREFDQPARILGDDGDAQ
ncbi:MAG TPA: hypothetical protein VFB02_24365 [Bradyrhizobium sp.]|nr:hypothetical protein [Bradyrhizobium sp.]